MRPTLFVALALVLAGCTGQQSPTEPAALALHDPPEPRPTVTPTPTPGPLAIGPSGSIVARPTPCFPNPWTDCGNLPRPTLAPGAATPTPDAGNWPTTIPGTIVITYWPTDTPTPGAP